PYLFFFFSTVSAPTHIYTLSLHDALPIFRHVLYITKYFTSTRFSCGLTRLVRLGCAGIFTNRHQPGRYLGAPGFGGILKGRTPRDRKSTRLNSSHDQISYAVFCLKKKSTQ